MTVTHPGIRRDVAATGELADKIAAAVAACPGVARLSPGPAATYLPHRTVPGVVINPDAVSIAIAARYGRPLPEIAAEVRQAVRRAAPDARVDVIIDDVAPDEAAPDEAAPGEVAPGELAPEEA